MRIELACFAVIVLAACQTAPERQLFDPVGLKASGEEDTATLNGWLSVTGEGGLVLYPTRAALAAKTRPGCVAVRPLSIAGIVTPDYNGKEMAIQGQLTPEAASGCPVTLVASDISVP
jgi:hypothetical protein